MATQFTTLPLRALHLRIRRDLVLCAFDDAMVLVGTVPLQDKMVSVMLVEAAGSRPQFVVTEDRAEPSMTYAVHLPIVLPSSDSEYFDLDAGDPTRYADQLYFQVGFRRADADDRTATLDGIGVVDIEDISILPVPRARVQATGWWARLWRCLFGPPPPPVSTSQGIIGIPASFPNSQSLDMKVELQFQIHADRATDGANHIRLGAFMGKETEDVAAHPFLAVCANPALVDLHAAPIFRIHP